MSPSPVTAPEEARDGGSEREWHRPLALVVFLVLASSWPLETVTLVAVPFVLLVVGLPVRRPLALLLAAGSAIVVVGGLGAGGFRYLEMGWTLAAGGIFVGATMIWPAARPTHRALGAVAGAATVAAVGFALRPGSWSVVDWGMKERLRDYWLRAMAAMQEVQGGTPLSADLRESVHRTAEVQAVLFPAVIGLMTLAGLMLAWWLYARLAAGERGALGAVREFRFEDQLVWVLIAGLMLVVLATGEGWTRAGSNTVVFMGALYALRGAAVVLFLTGGLSFFGGILVALAMLVMAPVLLAASALIGLGDTWLDVRTRVRTLLG